MSKERIIRIGTRESNLAQWQANEIKSLLEQFGVKVEIVLIKSEGDIDLVSPLYEMGIQGIFTKSLDTALLNNSIDIAVHSLKDVPTRLADGLVIACTPPRGNYKDVIVFKKETSFPLNNSDFILATSSLRRKAQWLHKYPNHTIVPLRGNINSRLQKLKNSETWDAAIFAAAGIERIQLDVPFFKELGWMLPAPGQGVLACVCREIDIDIINFCKKINHDATSIEANVERSFLRNLLGGCSTPIAAYSKKIDNTLYFLGNVLSVDGKNKIEIEMEFSPQNFINAGKLAADEILKQGAGEIIKTFKNREDEF